jgi:hypothetical protein
MRWWESAHIVVNSEAERNAISSAFSIFSFHWVLGPHSLGEMSLTFRVALSPPQTHKGAPHYCSRCFLIQSSWQWRLIITVILWNTPTLKKVASCQNWVASGKQIQLWLLSLLSLNLWSFCPSILSLHLWSKYYRLCYGYYPVTNPCITPLSLYLASDTS